MNPLVVLAVAALVVLATKRRNGPDGLDAWQFAAVFAGCLWPFAEVVLWLLGDGVYWQGRHALFWSLPLMPVFGGVVAGLMSPAVRMPVQRLLPGVLTGMLLTLLMGMLTADLVAPLATVSNVRVGLGWLHPLDMVVAGFAALGLVMGWVFPLFNRDMARLALGCVVIYVLASGGLAWEATRQARMYAKALALGPVEVAVRPGGGNPLYWEISVEERNGRLHTARVNLMHSNGYEAQAGEAADAFPPINAAVWDVASRFGEGAGLSTRDQRRVRLAWYGWQVTPFQVYSRTAVFDGFVFPPLGKATYCVRFRDVWDADAARFVICPAPREDEQTRVYRVRGGSSPVELGPVMGGRP